MAFHLFTGVGEVLSRLLECFACLLQKMSFVLGEHLSGALEVLCDLCCCIMRGRCDVSKVFVDLVIVVCVSLWLRVFEGVVYGSLLTHGCRTR